MLTQKGREPFVRMQLFLNEAQSLVCKSEAGNAALLAVFIFKGQKLIYRFQMKKVTALIFFNHGKIFENHFAELNGKFGAVQSLEMVPESDTNSDAKQNLVSGLLSMRCCPLTDEIVQEVSFIPYKYSNLFKA